MNASPAIKPAERIRKEAAQILLSDRIGGAMIVLSLTGLLLWTELEKRKLIGLIIALASLAAVAQSWA